MANRFPHLDNATDFPNPGNINVYEYENTYQYDRFDYAQMDIVLCKVPWDMGEAHVGNRTISGIGNVVFFETKEQRNAWFDNLPDTECIRFTTKYRELHRDNEITLPVPFDVAARYNYIYVHYNIVPNPDEPVEYEDADGLRDWFWFVREVEFLSPNTTRLHLLNDAWQTFIYDMDIPYMFLERGHAPMFATDIDTYLSNPIANCADLLADDVNYGEADVTASIHEHVWNAQNMHAVFVTTADITKTGWWDSATDTWVTPTDNGIINQGVLTYYNFAVPVNDLALFLSDLDDNMPNFYQTIQAIFFASSDLFTVSSTHSFIGHTCYLINSFYQTTTIHTLSKTDFAYPAEYANIAKLYTYPYSYIQLTDEAGNTTDIRIENTNGKIEFESVLSLAYPWINLTGHVSSVGKAVKRNISFTNINARTMPIAGNWAELIYKWDIPTFGVIQSGERSNNYNAYYDRKQAQRAYTNSYDSEVASADTLVANAALQVAANSANATISNTAADGNLGVSIAANSVQQLVGNTITQNTADSQVQASEMQAAIGAVGSLASSVPAALAGFAAAGPVGAAGAMVGSLIGAATNIAGTTVAAGLTQTQAGYAIQSNNLQINLSNTSNTQNTDIQKIATTDSADTANDLTTGTTANTAATQIANAGRTRDTAIGAIENQLKQAALNAPDYIGTSANGENAAIKPMALFSNVITQNDYAISRAGDDFLRYGYAYNRQWAFNGDWNVAPKFTYWKLSDFWVKGLQVPDMYVDKIRFFLFGGVTVWRDPADIGNVSIYENEVTI